MHDHALPAPRTPGAAGRLPVLVGLGIALGGPALHGLAGAAGAMDGLDMTQRLLLGEAVQWGLGAAVLAVALLWEGRPLSSLGLRRPGWRTLGVGALAALGLLVLLAGSRALIGAFSGPEGGQDGGMLELMRSLPVWAVLLLALRAGVVEEILFRGYAIGRLEELTGSTRLAAALSLAVFVAVHLRAWSPAHLLFVGIAGGALTALFLWRRDLGAAIVAHVLTDAVGLLAAHYSAA